MLQLGFYPTSNELLVDGTKNDYDGLALLTRRLFASPARDEVFLDVESTGEAPVKRMRVRKGDVPNCVYFDFGDIVFTIAPDLLDAFLSFIDVPPENELSRALSQTEIPWHNHYDWIWDDGRSVSKDSIDTVFTFTPSRNSSAS